MKSENTAVLRSRLKNRLKLGSFILFMIALPMLHFIFFYVYVNFQSVLMGFQVLKEGELVYSPENFRLLFQQLGDSESVIIVSLKNTMIFFGSSLLIVLPVSTFIAYFIYKKYFGSKFFRVMFFIPAILPAVVMTILYKNIIGIDGPIVSLFQKMAGLSYPPEFLDDSRYAVWAILFYTVWTGFGTNMILMSGAMARVPEEVVEAAKLDGVGQFRELVSLIIPLIWPTMTTLIVISFVNIFTASGPILLFTEGRAKTHTISYFIFEQVYNSNGRTEYASAVGIFFTLIAFPIVMLVRKFLERWDSVEY